jgi:hypothetical protein
MLAHAGNGGVPASIASAVKTTAIFFMTRSYA